MPAGRAHHGPARYPHASPTARTRWSHGPRTSPATPAPRARGFVVDNLPPRPGTVTLAGDPSEALTAQPSGFSGEDTTYDYRWERCDDAGCTEIGGAVSRTYGVRPRDAGRRLRAVVIATDGGGSVRVASQQSEPIPAPAAPRATQPAAT